MSSRNVFTIAYSAPALETFADNLISGKILPAVHYKNPETFGKAEILLPTRRACVHLNVILKQKLADLNCVIIPQINPLTELQNEEILSQATEQPEALTLYQRLLVFTVLVTPWINQHNKRTITETGRQIFSKMPVAAMTLAHECTSLLDELTKENIPHGQLKELKRSNYAQAQYHAIDLITTLSDVWHQYLQNMGTSDPTTEMLSRINQRCVEFRKAKTHHPLIIMGTTGTLRATRNMMLACAQSPNGAVVITGLDTVMDEESWQIITGQEATSHEHPEVIHHQMALKTFLKEAGLHREEVQSLWPIAQRDIVSNEHIARQEAILSEILRPAPTTHQWTETLFKQAACNRDQIINKLTLVEAVNEHEEAKAIALRVCESLHKGQTIKVLTTEQNMADRVEQLVRGYGHSVDNQFTQNLLHDETIQNLLSYIRFLSKPDLRNWFAYLKHRTTRLNCDTQDQDDLIANLEKAIISTPEKKHMIVRALEGARPLPDQFWPTEEMRQVFTPTLEPCLNIYTLKGSPKTLRDWLKWIEVTFSITHKSETDAQGQDEWSKERSNTTSQTGKLCIALSDGNQSSISEGEASGSWMQARLPQDVYNALNDDTAGLIECKTEEIFQTLFSIFRLVTITPPINPWSKATILTPLEGRLICADNVILSGFTELNWPKATATSVWITQTMRRDLGLVTPRWREAQSARDFAECFSHQQVMITWPRKHTNAITQPSRFLERMICTHDETAINAAKQRGKAYLDAIQASFLHIQQAENIWSPQNWTPYKPKPKVAASLKPRKISLTSFGRLIRDPYSFYAEKILKVFPLETLDEIISPAQRGELIHTLLQTLTEMEDDEFHNTSDSQLLSQLQKNADRIWPQDITNVLFLQLEKILKSARELEQERRRRGERVKCEVKWQWTLPLQRTSSTYAETLTLTARADRVVYGTEGTQIIDYKTGRTPTIKQVKYGLEPQLPILGLMYALQEPTSPPLEKLAYISVGTKENALNETRIAKSTELEGLLEEYREGAKKILKRYLSDDMVFIPKQKVMFVKQKAPYDHLARTADWSIVEDEDEE